MRHHRFRVVPRRSAPAACSSPPAPPAPIGACQTRTRSASKAFVLPGISDIPRPAPAKNWPMSFSCRRRRPRRLMPGAAPRQRNGRRRHIDAVRPRRADHRAGGAERSRCILAPPPPPSPAPAACRNRSPAPSAGRSPTAPRVVPGLPAPRCGATNSSSADTIDDIRAEIHVRIVRASITRIVTSIDMGNHRSPAFGLAIVCRSLLRQIQCRVVRARPFVFDCCPPPHSPATSPHGRSPANCGK